MQVIQYQQHWVQSGSLLQNSAYCVETSESLLRRFLIAGGRDAAGMLPSRGKHLHHFSRPLGKVIGSLGQIP